MIQNYLSYNINRYASKWLVLFIDLIIITFSFFLSYLIRFNLTLSFDTRQLLLQIPVIIVVSALAIIGVGSHKGVIRHTGVKDVYNIFNAICLASIIIIMSVVLNKNYELVPDFTIPLSIIIIHSLIAFIGLTASRFIFKILYHELHNSRYKNTRNILIYGTGESGIMAHNVITTSSKNIARVVGFIDDEVKKVGKQINGVKVFSRNNITENFITSKNISEIIFSNENIAPKKLREMIEGLVDLPVQVKIVPPVSDWVNGELKPSQIKQVQIEDLLNRAPIDIKNSRIGKNIREKTILVTGGAGSIGSELVRQICLYEYNTMIVVDQAESALYDLQQELKQNGYHNFVPIVADIRDKSRMNLLFQEFQPDIIFHAAAYKHVPLMEYNSYEAIKINVLGTKILADLACQYDVDKFVLISTDKAVNPTNVMGATKRIAEMYISCMQRHGKTKFITTRFGNVLGSNGSVIPLFRKQIAKGGPITVTHKDITRYFMTIPEASQLVLEAGLMGKGGEIFIFDMGESVKIYDLAKNMIHLSGLSYPDDINIKITGLRPGEKLYEELLANGEDTIPTYHKKIMISKARELDYSSVREKIDELCLSNMFLTGNNVKLMKEIVPEFISKNSKFAELDEEKENRKVDEGHIVNK